MTDAQGDWVRSRKARTSWLGSSRMPAIGVFCDPVPRAVTDCDSSKSFPSKQKRPNTVQPLDGISDPRNLTGAAPNTRRAPVILCLLGFLLGLLLLRHDSLHVAPYRKRTMA